MSPRSGRRGSDNPATYDSRLVVEVLLAVEALVGTVITSGRRIGIRDGHYQVYDSIARAVRNLDRVLPAGKDRSVYGLVSAVTMDELSLQVFGRTLAACRIRREFDGNGRYCAKMWSTFDGRNDLRRDRLGQRHNPGRPRHALPVSRATPVSPARVGKMRFHDALPVSVALEGCEAFAGTCRIAEPALNALRRVSGVRVAERNRISCRRCPVGCILGGSRITG